MWWTQRIPKTCATQMKVQSPISTLKLVLEIAFTVSAYVRLIPLRLYQVSLV